MKFCFLIANSLFLCALTALPLWASEIVEVGVFQVELLGPGESAEGGSFYQFDDPDTISGTTTWRAEQKEAGQGVTTAEAAWRDADVTDPFPEAADILIQYSRRGPQPSGAKGERDSACGNGLPGERGTLEGRRLSPRHPLFDAVALRHVQRSGSDEWHCHVI